MEESSDSGSSIFSGLLLIAFIVLKLVGVIDWSWWWVLSPLWIPLVAFLLFLLVWSLVIIVKGMMK